VEAIGTETHVTQEISTGAMPCALAVDAGRGMAYAVNYADASVSVIDARRDVTVGTVNVGGHPQAIAIDAAKHLAYVADAQDGIVSVIDTEQKRLLKKLRTDGRPYALAVDTKTHRIFAAIWNQLRTRSFLFHENSGLLMGHRQGRVDLGLYGWRLEGHPLDLRRNPRT
jgi:YVTN family beta-propeller protein